MPYNVNMIFIETSLFTKIISTYLNDDEYAALQSFLVENPEAGNIVRGSGGVRKLRWTQSGKGKRGGIRIIYFLKNKDNEIWMLTAYGKNEKSTIAGKILKKIAEEVKND